MAEIACARCGTFTDESSSYFSEAGDAICGDCQVLEEDEQLDKKTLQTLRAAAIGSTVCGLFCCNPGGLVSLIGLSAGYGAISGYRSQDANWKSAHSEVLIFGIIGLCLNLLRGALTLLSVLGLVAGGMQGF